MLYPPCLSNKQQVLQVHNLVPLSLFGYSFPPLLTERNSQLFFVFAMSSKRFTRPAFPCDRRPMAPLLLSPLLPTCHACACPAASWSMRFPTGSGNANAKRTKVQRRAVGLDRQRGGIRVSLRPPAPPLLTLPLPLSPRVRMRAASPALPPPLPLLPAPGSRAPLESLRASRSVARLLLPDLDPAPRTSRLRGALYG